MFAKKRVHYMSTIEKNNKLAEASIPISEEYQDA